MIEEIKPQEAPKESPALERRKKFRHQTGADSTHKPAPHSREKVWVKGHERGGGMFADGTHVEGHYRAAANPDDANAAVGSLALDNPKPPQEPIVNSPEPIVNPVPEIVKPIHKHTFKFVGLCNPKKGSKTQKLFKCVDCEKTFVE